MVLVQVHKSVLRVNQSKVRKDYDPWHDVAIPLNPGEMVRLRAHNSVKSQVITVHAVMNMKSVTIPTQRRGVTLWKFQHLPQG